MTGGRRRHRAENLSDHTRPHAARRVRVRWRPAERAVVALLAANLALTLLVLLVVSRLGVWLGDQAIRWWHSW